MTAPASLCLWRHAAPVEPYSTRESKCSVLARYRCPVCRLRWLVCWDAASLARREAGAA